MILELRSRDRRETAVCRPGYRELQAESKQIQRSLSRNGLWVLLSGGD